MLINEIIEQFPLVHGAKIENSSKLSDTIDLFGSLLAERLKSRLIDQFPNTNLDKISATSTIQEIYDLVIDNNNKGSIPDNIINEKSSFNIDNQFLENLNLDSSLFDNKYSLGIDIESRESIPLNIYTLKSTSFRKRIFTSYEVAYSLTKADPELTLVGIYSAKESIIKALNNKRKINYGDIEITHNVNGKPFPLISNLKNNNLIISISHFGDLAISACIFFSK